MQLKLGSHDRCILSVLIVLQHPEVRLSHLHRLIATHIFAGYCLKDSHLRGEINLPIDVFFQIMACITPDKYLSYFEVGQRRLLLQTWHRRK